MEIKMTIIYEKADGLIQASVAELPGAISLGADVEEARRIWMKQSRWCWKETAC
jgi:predicted RNase H-like HicB family nuclease